MDNKILFEAYVEIGPNNVAHVYRNRGVYEKSSRGNALNSSLEKTTATPDDKRLIMYVVNILKKKGLFKKIATKDDTTTMDIQFNAGSALVNFDDGGSISVPIPKSASVKTNYFPY